MNRVQSYQTDFSQLVQRNAKLRCVTKPPKLNGSMSKDPEYGKQAIRLLLQTGSVVDLRNKIHEKIILLDEKILWIGSLNPLSYNEKISTEIMLRLSDREIALQIIELLSLPSPHKKPDFSDQENPRCERCKRLSVYYQYSSSGCWKCSEGCGWVMDTHTGRSKKQTHSVSRHKVARKI